MVMAFTAKNKMGFVDGSIPQLLPTNDQHEAWLRVNNMVLSWLLNSIHRDLAPSVLYVDSIAAIWKDLHDRFSSSNSPCVFVLERTIATLQQNSDSVAKYFNALKSCWDELATYHPLPTCSCGEYRTFAAHTQTRQLMQFLMGLNESYASIRSQILLMDPLPTLGRAYSLVLQDESQRLLHLPSISEGSGLLATPSLLAAPTIDGSTSSGSANAVRSHSRSKDRCSYFHILGHNRDACYKLNSYPPNYRAACRSRDTTSSATATGASTSPITTDQYQ
ncbi:uncharacterized protein LOC122651869 [Telopea speciosissima]|uniref:uncharacterized protein LOC122651869 n=1 Tax=Telopea speciosissima TaxID=54955 RepID=UPI001CC60983|nr:uncharacterized protein LOC122651869 [Telopea speciosissima]